MIKETKTSFTMETTTTDLDTPAVDPKSLQFVRGPNGEMLTPGSAPVEK